MSSDDKKVLINKIFDKLALRTGLLERPMINVARNFVLNNIDAVEEAYNEWQRSHHELVGKDCNPTDGKVCPPVTQVLCGDNGNQVG